MSEALTSDMLIDIMRHQHHMQRDVYGQDPMTLEGEARVQFIKDMILASTDELHEALAEVGWKPWATSRHVNEEALKGELIDMLHFLVNLMLAARMGPNEVHRRYFGKAAKNQARQVAGYDGVTGKCPGCGRALDDEGVTCSLEAGCTEAVA